MDHPGLWCHSIRWRQTARYNARKAAFQRLSIGNWNAFPNPVHSRVLTETGRAYTLSTSWIYLSPESNDHSSQIEDCASLVYVLTRMCMFWPLYTYYIQRPRVG